MAEQGYTDGPYKAFPEETAGELLNKVGYPVEFVAANGSVQLLNAGVAIGVVHLREQTRSGDKAMVTVRLLGGGGSLKIRQAAAVAAGARAKIVAGGISTAASGDYARGTKLTPTGNGAVGDIVEMLDQAYQLP